jgi:SsrA-binding protein
MARSGDKIVISNRRARHDYEILESFECGVALVGSEVKSLRGGRGNLQDAYARIDDGEVWLHGMHVSPYSFAREGHDPTRRRKLLLHREQIEHLLGKTAEKGLTLVPLRVYFQDGLAKVELALARGKKRWDKRQAIAERDSQREVERLMKSRRRGDGGGG